MCVYIGIDSLAVRSLYDELGEDTRKRFVSYDDMESYGLMIKKYFDDNSVKSILILSPNSFREFLSDYSDFFYEDEKNGEIGISLKSNKTRKDLLDRFSGKFSLELLIAFSKTPYTYLKNV